jgi:hypothetical protein
MHSCRSSTAVLRHRVSSTRSHSPGPLPSLIHPVYWPVFGSQSLLNPRDHPRYLPPYHIDRTRSGPGGYRRVFRERARLPWPPLHFPSLRPWRSSGFTPSGPNANRRAGKKKRQARADCVRPSRVPTSLYTWKLNEANNVAIKKEVLWIMLYETYGEHRDTSPLQKETIPH